MHLTLKRKEVYGKKVEGEAVVRTTHPPTFKKNSTVGSLSVCPSVMPEDGIFFGRQIYINSPKASRPPDTF